MNKFGIMLNGVNINKSSLKVELAVVHNMNDVTPKIRAVFTRGDKLRRLPLLFRNSFNKKNSDEKVMIFSYSYSLPYIFKDDCFDDISLSFEVTLGDKTFENIPFYLSSSVKTENADEKYIAGDLFSGVVCYGKQKDDEELELTDDVIYSCIPEPENKRIVIKSQKNDIQETDSKKIIVSKIFNVLSDIFNIILTVLLLPYFIIDGILAGLGLVRKSKYSPTDSYKNEIIGQIKANTARFLGFAFKSRETALKIIKPAESVLTFYYNKYLLSQPVNQNQIAFISGRRDELGGNEKFIYDLLKDNKDIHFEFLLCSDVNGILKFRNRKRFYELYATSKVVIVDDYLPLLNRIKKREDVMLFQLWHACGAFKTFGFSRLGKPGGPKQTSPDHRMYDYATVSSEEIRKYYAEGFGISDSNVIATGVPRTDIFFDDKYSVDICDSFYQRHPALMGKKIILFAPTFRGNGQRGAYYPLEVFNPERILDKIGKDYVIIIKLHPFCKERYNISEEYKDKIIDLSDEDELNDLLFVTDLLITDYSSAVFEASLLNIPMLFYPYDLYQYISERDFYCDYEDFVPGKIVFSEKEIIDSIINNNFKEELVEPFKNKYFTYTDGKASQRVADKILECLRKN